LADETKPLGKSYFNSGWQINITMLMFINLRNGWIGLSAIGLHSVGTVHREWSENLNKNVVCSV
jgi:hypothetical protein